MQEGNNEITAVIAGAEQGDPSSTEQLFALLYEHLRRMASARLAKEARGITLQPTALVNEAYLRLVGADVRWECRCHFFAAAARAMRRILVDRGRQKHGPQRGGGRLAVPLSGVMSAIGTDDRDTDEPDWLALDDAMHALEEKDADLALIVHLRYFAGLTVDQTAQAVGRGARSIDRDWKLARAWLIRHMQRSSKAG